MNLSTMNNNPSFKDKLLADVLINDIAMQSTENIMEADIPECSNTTGEEATKDKFQVHLSAEDMRRIYQQWRYSVIIKLLDKRILHQYLKKKIQELWRPTENFLLIDLVAEYYIVKFSKEENMIKALQNGP